MHSFSIVNSDKLQNAVENAKSITKRNIIKFQDYMPIYCSSNGIYPYQKNFDAKDNNYNWARGFWAGIVWLLYELEPKNYIKIYGEKLTQSIQANINKRGLGHSNMGFLVIPSCIPNYRFTKSSIAKETVIMAANNLMTKYNSLNKFICYYDHELDGNVLCCIISNLINSQLLNFAYKFSGNLKYKEVAKNDVDSVIENNIALSGKTFFSEFFDKNTGRRMDGPDSLLMHSGEDVPLLSYKTSDGFSTRAYAWALYGLAINYALTKNDYYKERFSAVFDFLELNSEKDKIYSSNFYETNRYVPDSTSTAIIAAALSDYVKNDEITDNKYLHALSRLANMLIEIHSVSAQTNKECLLYHGYASENGEKTKSTLFGDYFYFEMLVNLLKERESFWYTKYEK